MESHITTASTSLAFTRFLRMVCSTVLPCGSLNTSWLSSGSANPAHLWAPPSSTFPLLVVANWLVGCRYVLSKAKTSLLSGKFFGRASRLLMIWEFSTNLERAPKSQEDLQRSGATHATLSLSCTSNQSTAKLRCWRHSTPSPPRSESATASPLHFLNYVVGTFQPDQFFPQYKLQHGLKSSKINPNGQPFPLGLKLAPKMVNISLQMAQDRPWKWPNRCPNMAQNHPKSNSNRNGFGWNRKIAPKVINRTLQMP